MRPIRPIENKIIRLFTLIALIILPALSFAAWDKNLMRGGGVTLEDQSIGVAVGGDFGYLFSRGLEAGSGEDKLLSSEAILSDEDNKVIAGHVSCNFIDRNTATKLFVGETVMYNSDNTLPLGADTACLLVGGDNVLIKGNIYGRRQISSQFSLKDGVAISGEKTKESVKERLSYYSVEPGSTAAWDNSKEYKNVFMRSNIMKWRDQRATKMTTNQLTNRFHLNPVSGSIHGSAGRLDDENYPEGKTWYYSGDFAIRGGAIEFGGRGTIIVEGNLTIDAESLTPYQDDNNNDPNDDKDSDMLGFIVLPKGGSGGNVEITSKVKNLKASFFVPGKTGDVVNPDTGLPQSGIFHIQGSADPNQKIEIEGSIVANGIDLREPRAGGEGNYGVKIVYDDRLVTIPPPGFTREMIASFQESAP